jgi:cytochrome d ubiquinol oxidase subunit II
MSLDVFWFCVVAFFWAGYLMLEGFDFGVGMLLPFLARDEEERTTMFESIGPVWDGNEVWLVIAGGATFAAFPAWYGTMFSGFYLALLLVLVLLIIRVVSFEWREKSESPHWRRVWLYANATGSFGASLIWGIALANLLHGVPLNSSGDYTGTFWDLFSPYTVVAGLAVVALFAFHGATYLTLRTRGALHDRAVRFARRLSVPAAVLAIGFYVWTVVVAVQDNDRGVFPPILPAMLGVGAVGVAVVLTVIGRNGWAFLMTAAAAVLMVATLFVALYPRVMVSSTGFSNSLTVSGTASAHYTLAVMTVVAVVVTPVVLLYQGWTYHVFRARLGRAADATVDAPPHPAR